MTATVTATPSDVTHANTALDALGAAEQWRARRADAAASPAAWAAARRAVRFGGRSAGHDGFGGSTGVRRGSSMRALIVAVRDDQGPHALTNRG